MQEPNGIDAPERTRIVITADQGSSVLEVSVENVDSAQLWAASRMLATIGDGMFVAGQTQAPPAIPRDHLAPGGKPRPLIVRPQ